MLIKRKLQLNVAVSALTALIICLMLFVTMQRIKQAMDADDIADNLIRSLFERSTLREDYLRTNSERAKEQWFAKQEQVGGLLKSASVKFGDTERRKTIVNALIRNHETAGKLFFAIVRNREMFGADAGSYAFSKEVEGRLLTQLSLRLYDDTLHAVKLQALSSELLLTALRQAGGGIVGVLLIITAAALVNSWSMSRTISKRIRRMCGGAAVIGGGNLDHRIDIQGDDEFVELSEAFNAMTVKLCGSYHDLEKEIEERKRAETELLRAHYELELRVKERTAELATTVETLLEEIAERERMEASLQRLNRLYAVLAETGQTIIRVHDREALFQDFCRIAVEEGNFLLAWAGLVDEGSGQVRMMAACGATSYLDDIGITATADPAGGQLTGIPIRNETYYICNDFLNDPDTAPWHDRGRAHGVRSLASVAIKEEGRMIGAFTLYASEKDFFDQQHVDLLVQMGADISFAIDNLSREARRQNTEKALQEETLERLMAVEALREKEQLLIQQSRQAAMGEMINNIAHQWRQPLNALGLIIQQLSLYYDLGRINRDFLDQSVCKSMGLIKYMSKTIDDFRNYFKPDKEKAAFQVHEAIQSSLTLMDGSLQSPKISIEVISENKPVINGYQNEFAQVILNILINARDALIQGEVNDPKITVTISSEHGGAVVTVADNAGGIPEHIIGKIFDPYFTTKGPQQGTGVGLFMSKTIIEKNMGGWLSVRNTAEGAEFRIEVTKQAESQHLSQDGKG